MSGVTVLGGGQVLREGKVIDADVAFTDKVLAIGTGLAGDERIDVSGSTIIPGLIDAHVHLLSGSKSQIRALQTPLSLRFYQALPVLRATLQGGATYVRDASGADAGVRQAIDQGIIEGPKLKVAIRIMHTTGGHGDGYVASGQELRPFSSYPGSPDTLIDGPHQTRNVARQLIRAGADVLKVAVTGGTFTGPRPSAFKTKIRRDELTEVVSEARAEGIQ